MPAKMSEYMPDRLRDEMPDKLVRECQLVGITQRTQFCFDGLKIHCKKLPLSLG